MSDVPCQARREERGPASREVAHNVFSFTSTGLYISLFIITEDGVMVTPGPCWPL